MWRAQNGHKPFPQTQLLPEQDKALQLQLGERLTAPPGNIAPGPTPTAASSPRCEAVTLQHSPSPLAPWTLVFCHWHRICSPGSSSRHRERRAETQTHHRLCPGSPRTHRGPNMQMLVLSRLPTAHVPVGVLHHNRSQTTCSSRNTSPLRSPSPPLSYCSPRHSRITITDLTPFGSLQIQKKLNASEAMKLQLL